MPESAISGCYGKSISSFRVNWGGPIWEGQWCQNSSGHPRRRLGAEQPWWWQAFPTRWPVPKMALSSVGRCGREAAQQSCPIHPQVWGWVIAWALELRHSENWELPGSVLEASPQVSRTLDNMAWRCHHTHCHCQSYCSELQRDSPGP